MPKRTFIAGLFVVVLLASSVQAVSVKRVRHIREQTNIKELFSSIARGLGYRLGEEPDQDELAGLKEKVKQLGLQFEFMNVTLRDDQGNEQEFSVQEIDGAYQIVLGAPKVRL